MYMSVHLIKQQTNSKNSHGRADGHRHKHAQLVVAYLQSQSQASSLRQRGDKTQWILVISTFCQLGSHVTANWEKFRNLAPRSCSNQPSFLSSTPKWCRR